MNKKTKNNTSDYLDGLNPKQREAVETLKGPVLIIAGAGAGKTKTITHRILHLIKTGIASESILAITFTNKAAKEMRERVTELLNQDRDFNLPVSGDRRPTVSTFHALGVQIIKENAALLNLPRHFTIFDRNDSKKAIKEGIIARGFDPKQLDPGKVLGVISREKGNGLTQSEYEADTGNEYFPRIVAEVWLEYEKALKKERALDFDDLLLRAVNLLQTNKEVLGHYQNRWRYVHIDEYQDTNKIQYKMANLLVREHQNICAVGDADQNIYSWRGAEIRNILNFETDYPKTKIILLEENYRSTKTILAVANTVIKKNKFRNDKNLFTQNKMGEKISLYESYDEANEASFVASKSQDLITRGVKPSQIAVLYRANFQSRALEEAFLRAKVPYQLLGVRFYERKEVKDILSYLKAALNPDSLSDIKRVINVPARGIGKVTLLKLFSNQEDTLPAKMRAKIANFRSLLVKIKTQSEILKPSPLIKFIIKESGLEDSLKQGKEEEQERLENIGELVTLATRYDNQPLGAGLEQFLTDAALASEQDGLKNELEAVRLMTVHAAKGLEFDQVFIVGLEEGLFPHERSGEEHHESEAAEEERRLFYVALTRARVKIYLSYAQNRMVFGQREINVPSEFIFDIDEKHLEREDYFEDMSERTPLVKIEF